MHSIYALIVVLAAAAYAFLRPRDFALECERLVEKLPSQQLELIEPFICEPRPDYSAFVKASNGFRGIIQMWANMTVYLRIIQLFYAKKRISKADAAQVWVLALCETMFTIASALEFLFLHIAPWFPMVGTVEAARFHRDLVYRVDTLCSFKGAPKCILDIPNLL